jgi:Ca2+-binding RTX toxin-like protein
MGAGNDNVSGAGGHDIFDGGFGADLMRGGSGNDVYTVDNAGDQVLELSGEGADTVKSLVSFSLAGGYAETLVLQGSASWNATGNQLANAIVGNAGNNVITGGLGLDKLTGFAGDDRFLFDTAPHSTANYDKISDMNVAGNDTVWLDDAIFLNSGAAGTTLAPSAFKNVLFGAIEGDDRIVYNPNSGSIYYDRDGSSGAFALTKFAEVASGTALTSFDFFIV